MFASVSSLVLYFPDATEFVPWGFPDLAYVFLWVLDFPSSPLAMNPLPGAWHHLGLDPGHCFLPGFPPLSALLIRPDRAVWISKLAETKPRVSLAFESGALDVVCCWVVRLVSEWLLKVQFQVPHDLTAMLWKQCQEANVCLSVLGWVEWVALTILNGPTIILNGKQKSLYLSK